jgi:hypothetical protein
MKNEFIVIVNLNNQKLMEKNESTPSQDRPQGISQDIHERVLPKE